MNTSHKTPIWHRVFPTGVDLLAILGIFFVAQFIGFGATYLLGYGFDNAALDSVDETVRSAAQQAAGEFSMMSYLITMIITLLGAFLLRRIRGGKGRIVNYSMLGFNPSVLLWGVVMLFAVTVIFDPLMSYLPDPPEVYGRGWAMILTVVLAAPIFEEFLCRGLILGSIRAKSGVWSATIISSLFFGIMHFHPALVINALIIGMLLGYLYIRTNSIFAPIILHSFNNALAYILVWTGFENITLRGLIENNILYTIIYLTAVVTLGISLYKIVRQLARLNALAKENKGGDIHFAKGEEDEIFPHIESVETSVETTEEEIKK